MSATRFTLRGLVLLAAVTPAAYAAQTYTDTQGDQVGSSNKARDIWSVVMDNDANNLIVTVNLDPGANLGTSTFDFGVGMNAGPASNGDNQSNATTHGNAYSRLISIDPSLGGMTAWIGGFPALAPGVPTANQGTASNPWTSYGFNNYVWTGTAWTKKTQVLTGMTLTSQGTGTTPSSFTLVSPLADFTSVLNTALGSTIYFDVFDTGTSNTQGAYDSLADASPTPGAAVQYNATTLLSYRIHGLAGDANYDGTINGDDFAIVDAGKAASRTGWANGDFNNDGVIDQNDYLLMDTNYGIQIGAFDPAFLDDRRREFGDAYVAQLLAAVPEPASLAACGLVMLPLIRRRR